MWASEAAGAEKEGVKQQKVGANGTMVDEDEIPGRMKALLSADAAKRALAMEANREL